MLDPSSVKQVLKLAAKLCQLTFGQAFDGSGPRHGAIAGLEDQFDYKIGRKSECWSCKDVRELFFQDRKGRVVHYRQREGGIDKLQRGEVKLSTIVGKSAVAADPNR